MANRRVLANSNPRIFGKPNTNIFAFYGNLNDPALPALAE